MQLACVEAGRELVEAVAHLGKSWWPRNGASSLLLAVCFFRFFFFRFFPFFFLFCYCYYGCVSI
eukprot:COSAG05_NODE_1123_length_5793_cov_4.158588_6_plen_64_part_00